MKQLLSTALLLCITLGAFAQEYVPYIPEDQLPDVVQCIPAPPSVGKDHAQELCRAEPESIEEIGVPLAVKVCADDVEQLLGQKRLAADAHGFTVQTFQ